VLEGKQGDKSDQSRQREEAPCWLLV